MLKLPFPQPFLHSSRLTPLLVDRLFQLAQSHLAVLESGEKAYPLLRGRTVATLFQEDSTRTRCSFELAAKYLGAHTLHLAATGSSLAKGETIEDTLETLLAMGVDAVVMRHGEEGRFASLEPLFGHRVGLLNAGEGRDDHPTQALLDAFTLWQRWGGWSGLSGKKLVIVGDLLHSRVVRAHLRLWQQVGHLDIHLAGPPALAPRRLAQEYACTVHHQLDAALAGAHAVMGLRLQRERFANEPSLLAALEDYTRQFQLTPERLQAACANDWVFLHPGPVNRNVEATDGLVDHPTRSLVRTQVRHGVAVRMACLHHLLWAPHAVPAVSSSTSAI